MNRRSFLLMLTVTATTSCLLPAIARAECFMPFLNTGSAYCDGCLYEGTISLNRNETCERVSQMPDRTAYTIEYVGSRIIQRAKHGTAGANGPVIAYQPMKDFVGTDDFTMEMSYRQSGRPGKYTAHYVVTVK